MCKGKCYVQFGFAAHFPLAAFTHASTTSFLSATVISIPSPIVPVTASIHCYTSQPLRVSVWHITSEKHNHTHLTNFAPIMYTEFLQL